MPVSYLSRRINLMHFWVLPLPALSTLNTVRTLPDQLHDPFLERLPTSSARPTGTLPSGWLPVNLPPHLLSLTAGAACPESCVRTGSMFHMAPVGSSASDTVPRVCFAERLAVMHNEGTNPKPWGMWPLGLPVARPCVCPWRCLKPTETEICSPSLTTLIRARAGNSSRSETRRAHGMQVHMKNRCRVALCRLTHPSVSGTSLPD